VARPFRRHVDEEILDRAAELFASHGFAQTSLQALADVVGLSKAGLLHHYPSKEALFEAAKELGRTESRGVLGQVGTMPPGPERDRRALELLTDVALARPGLVALVFRSATTPDTRTAVFHDDDMHVFAIFATDPAADAAAGRPERLVRVIGALSALAMLSLAAHHVGDATAWRPQIIATCFDALGHRRRDTPSPSPDVEA
jgi:AcrR family transcriptional regulator